MKRFLIFHKLNHPAVCKLHFSVFFFCNFFSAFCKKETCWEGERTSRFENELLKENFLVSYRFVLSKQLSFVTVTKIFKFFSDYVRNPWDTAPGQGSLLHFYLFRSISQQHPVQRILLLPGGRHRRVAAGFRNPVNRLPQPL